MADLTIALQRTLKLEGGDANHPLDRGGKTRWGISAPLLEHAIRLGIVRGLDTINDAIAIYDKLFWSYLRLNLVEDQEIANEIFDTAVLCGPGRAVSFLQRILRLYGNPLTVDGTLGPVTLAALNGARKHYPAILVMLNVLQGMHHITDVERNPEQLVFLDGWINKRVNL